MTGLDEWSGVQNKAHKLVLVLLRYCQSNAKVRTLRLRLGALHYSRLRMVQRHNPK